MHYISKLLTKCLEEQHLKIIRSNRTFNQQKLISLVVLSSFIEAEVFITKLNLEGFEKSILIYFRKNYRLVKKMHSLQYISIIRTSTQDNNADNCQQYEELHISENGCPNIEFRHWNEYMYYYQLCWTIKKIIRWNGIVNFWQLSITPCLTVSSFANEFCSLAETSFFYHY